MQCLRELYGLDRLIHPCHARPLPAMLVGRAGYNLLLKVELVFRGIVVLARCLLLSPGVGCCFSRRHHVLVKKYTSTIWVLFCFCLVSVCACGLAGPLHPSRRNKP